MKPHKMIADCAMIILLPLLMAYSLIGEDIHEWLGIAMFAVFIIHHIFNRKFLTTITKGKYTPARVYSLVVNILLFIIMLALPISGILMSKHAVPFLSITGGASYARTVHMTCAYWGFVLMSLHLGNHAAMIMNMPRKLFKIKEPSKTRTAVLRCIAALICIYGIYALFKRKILSYLFMQMMFAFFDPSESRLLFFVDYIAMMLTFAIAGHYISLLLKRSSKKPSA